jgi:hypothetical protein
VRAAFIVRDDLPPHLRRGVFARPHTYRAWVRFSGPGPDMPADIDDVGFVSCAIKLMDVPGPKLMEDEKHTQDFISVCTPTFVTPDINANAMLQVHVLRGTPIFYFFTTGFSHFLDFLMQGLWNETQTSPLEARYWSCVPYLLGEGQAMMYSVRPKSNKRSWIPGLPFWTSPIYLREAMVKTLSEHDVELDFLVQVQTDPHRMPIEDAGVRWPIRSGGNAADSATDVRFTGAIRLRAQPFLHAVALHRRAPAARQPEPRAPPDVLGAPQAAPDHEQHAPHRADRERGVSLGRRAREIAQRGEPGHEEIGAAAHGHELR